MVRTLWIDAICIDQANPEERNQQVQMMSRIYTRSANVCIWLGEDGDEDQRAINFIREEITHLKEFDAISSDEKYSEKWHALMMLMQREWFSRRWVVQEISLAKDAQIYCGPYSVPWKEFAVAVELFVEVETATHRLSEVMWKDKKFQHVPGMFEYVSELGASLLVQATGKVFRAHGTPMDNDNDDYEKTEDSPGWIENVHTIDPLDRRSLLSLEYLVTTMSIFRATECRDSIYSMLAIARDAAPFADPNRSFDDVSLSMTLFDSFLAEKPFRVDYSRQYSDVCRDFVEFCIQRAHAREPVQALDILCRPWALEPPHSKSIRLSPKDSTRKRDEDRLKPRRELSWRKRVCESQWKSKKRKWILVKTECDTWVEDERTMEEYWKENEMKENKAILDPSWAYTSGLCQRDSWRKAIGWERVQALVKGPKARSLKVLARGKSARDPSSEEISHDLDLPSWVCRAKKAPFELYAHPGMNIKKTGRANANPLVGEPKDGHRNYSAAQTKGVTLGSSDGLKFRKRPCAGHYSLYVKGFIIDEVEAVAEASQGGNIPRSWLDLGGWESPYDKDPPAELWRTLVADRGFDNRNPPYYYARACRESVNRGAIASGRVNTTALINNERNSIIAEFCRRVHAVIWARSMFRTKSGNLGIAASDIKVGDQICILYGCTVPVVLRKKQKDPKNQKDDEFEDQFEAFKSCFQKLERIMVRKYRYNTKKSEDPNWEKQVKKNTVRVNRELTVFKSDFEEDQKKKEQRKKAREKDRKEEEERGTGHRWKAKLMAKLMKIPLIVDHVWIVDLSSIAFIALASIGKSTSTAVFSSIGIPTLLYLLGKGTFQDAENYYIFKGESYVHGYMDGEALRAKFYREKGAEDQIFELR
ncbi:HET-domain-containing protein [Stemphylium lycopersici]|uniref:HET-domain-containing protein n=1 Tax=Stemphylium lycopersici TaxID=183478 RepID=A0A364NBD4_STELY|nr:HET-domain-containing protein [Stemphylium lycopersici]RAR14638.1 HET-domain-containing protein [Stemphylium lycopersici]